MKKSILLVDDEKALRLALKEALAESGYEVIAAGTGEEALEHARSHTFDLVITDLKMPGISGLELVEKIKASAPSTMAIVMSAYGTMESAIEAMRLGASDFIVKPVKIETMRVAVERALRLANSTHRPDDKILTIVPKGENPEERIDFGKLSPFTNYLEESCFVLPNDDQGNSPNRIILDSFTSDELTSIPAHCVGDTNVKHNDDFAATIFGLIPQEIDHHSAELLKTIIKTAFRCEIEHNPSPQRITKKINRILCQNLRPVLPISLLCALWDKATLRYVSAGEELTTYIRTTAGKFKILEGESYALGTFPNVTLEEREAKWNDGEMIITIAGLPLNETKNATLQTSVAERSCEAIANEVKTYLGKYQISAIMVADLSSNLHIQQNLSLGVKAQYQSSKNTASHLTVHTRGTKSRRGGTYPRAGLDSTWHEIEEIIIPAAITDLGHATDKIESTLTQMGIDQAKQHQIITAIMEAVINSILHGYEKDNLSKEDETRKIEEKILIRFTMQGKELITEVFDQGKGFNLQSYHPPDVNNYEDLFKENGRGIFLMRNLMTRVAIESKIGVGTKIHMAKAIV